ncbi:MAG TPA: terminase family protein [Bryobacteraceae bacterium]|nr:terminase family protein [Bryobacteraceae bacterium]
MPTTRDRSESARTNGAQSRGPKTEAGKLRCAEAARLAAANRKAAQAITFDCTLLPTESQAVYAALAQAEFAHWQPATPTQTQLVHELIDLNWRIRRLRFAQSQALLAHMESQRLHAQTPSLAPTLAANAEIDSPHQLPLDRRISLLTAARSRILRDLERLAKRLASRPGSQPPLQTQHLPAQMSWQGPNAPTLESVPAFTYPAAPETLEVPPCQDTPTESRQKSEPLDILAWSQSNLDFHPDPHQAELMTTSAPRVLHLAARQTGKSTAAAVRAVYEALHHDNATILLAGPTGRQSGQIMTKARAISRRLGQISGGPPPGCDGFRLANGSHILSLPDNDDTIRGFSAPRLIIVDEAAFASTELITALQPMLAVSNGTMILLSTPNGQSGYFYEKWHESNGPWRRILCKADDCTRIRPETLEQMRQTLTASEYDQEFNCAFLAPAGQFISRELFHRALSPDVKPLFEDED